MERILFSVEHETNNELTNVKLSNLMEELITTLDGKVMIGCYNGLEERSFEVSGKHFDLVVNIALTTGQESILLIDSDDNAQLYFPFRREYQDIGKWQRVSKEVALDSLCYTKDPKGGYYVAA